MKFIFFTFLYSFLIIVVSSKAQTPNEKEQIWSIDKCVNQFSMNDTVQTKVGYQYWFADKDFIDGRTLKMSVVAPHSATHPPHTHIEDEFFFILEGTARLYLNGDSVTANPYASFYCPSGIEHGIRNIGNTELKYLVIKKYIK